LREIEGNKEKRNDAEQGQERSNKNWQELGKPASPERAWVRPPRATRKSKTKQPNPVPQFFTNPTGGIKKP